MDTSKGSDFNITFGDPEAQQEFREQNAPFIGCLKNLLTAFDSAIFNMTIKERELEGRTVFYLSRMIWEDFNEILVLCANGLSTGAMKILRGMFERTVIAAYLLKHGDEAKLFWDYYLVDRRKLANAIVKEYPEAFSKEKLKELEDKYDEVKDSFQVPVCRVCKDTNCNECKKTKTNHAWSKKDIFSMSKEVGMDIYQIMSSYYVPMQETHPKASAILRRMKLKKDNTIDYDDVRKPDFDEMTLISAHWLILKTLEVLQETFEIEAMKEPIQQCLSDFTVVWKDRREILPTP